MPALMAVIMASSVMASSSTGFRDPPSMTGSWITCPRESSPRLPIFTVTSRLSVSRASMLTGWLPRESERTSRAVDLSPVDDRPPSSMRPLSETKRKKARSLTFQESRSIQPVNRAWSVVNKPVLPCSVQVSDTCRILFSSGTAVWDRSKKKSALV